MPDTSKRAVWTAAVAVVWIVCLPIGHARQAASVNGDLYGRMHWRFIGPEGNRFSAAAGIPAIRMFTTSVRRREASTRPLMVA